MIVYFVFSTVIGFDSHHTHLVFDIDVIIPFLSSFPSTEETFSIPADRAKTFPTSYKLETTVKSSDFRNEDLEIEDIVQK